MLNINTRRSVEISSSFPGVAMGRRVQTGCANCKRCTNSATGEAGRKMGRAMVAMSTAGLSEMARATTRNCRACGHKMSLHDGQAGTPAGSNVTVVVQQPPPQSQPVVAAPVSVPAGWYPDPNGAPCRRWWEGYNWTDQTAPVAL